MADQVNFHDIWAMKSTPTISGDDDEWGDFIAPPQSHQIPLQSNGFHSIPTSKHIDPFGISKGPLPLSIFGEIEEEEEEKGFEHVGGSVVIEGLRKRVDSGVGIEDQERRDSQKIDGEIGVDLNFDGSGLDSRVDRDSGERDGEIEDGDDDYGWEFKGAFDDNFGVGDHKVRKAGQDTSLVVENKPEVSSSYGFDDWFAASGAGYDKSSGNNHGWNSDTAASVCNGSIPIRIFGTKDVWRENGLSSRLVDVNEDFDEFGDFIVAHSEVGTRHQESQSTLPAMAAEAHLSDGKDVPSKLENGNGALPLSLFSDGVVDNVDLREDIMIQKLPSDPKFRISKIGSGVSIHDLVSTLHSESLPNGQGMHTSAVIPGTVNDETVSQPSQMLASIAENGDDFYDNNSWEFKDASSTGLQQHATSPEQGVAQQFSTKPSSVLAHVELYEKLRDELCLLLSNHLDDLKKAQNVSKDGNAGDINKKIQEANKMLKDNVLSHGVHADEQLPRKSRLDEILELLHTPEFQVLESEYLLLKRLHLAQKNWKSSVDFLKHVQMVLKVLTLASAEEQSAYLSTWARIIAVCSEELRHGSFIWNQAFENSIHGQLLSDTRGQRHIRALGEIYRVVQLLGLSAQLYKPWILLNSANLVDMFPLLDECATLWSDSGLEERLENLSDVVETKSWIPIRGVLESIKYIRDIDVLSMLDLDFAAPASFCQMTLLPIEILAGLETVPWNERLYFLSVANLWANLCSSEPLQLPRLCG